MIRQRKCRIRARFFFGAASLHFLQASNCKRRIPVVQYKTVRLCMSERVKGKHEMNEEKKTKEQKIEEQRLKEQKAMEELAAQLEDLDFKKMRPGGAWTYIMYALCVLFVVGGIYNICRGYDLQTSIITIVLGLGIAYWPWYNVHKNGMYGGVVGITMKKKEK